MKLSHRTLRFMSTSPTYSFPFHSWIPCVLDELVSIMSLRSCWFVPIFNWCIRIFLSLPEVSESVQVLVSLGFNWQTDILKPILPERKVKSCYQYCDSKVFFFSNSLIAHSNISPQDIRRVVPSSCVVRITLFTLPTWVLITEMVCSVSLSNTIISPEVDFLPLDPVATKSPFTSIVRTAPC